MGDLCAGLDVVGGALCWGIGAQRLSKGSGWVGLLWGPGGWDLL